MKKFEVLVLFAILWVFIGCSTSDDKDIIIENINELQQEIRTVSNELEGLDLAGLPFTDNAVEIKIEEFKNKREEQKSNIIRLESEFNEELEFETIICGDFEDLNCFVENWDVRKDDEATVKISTDCTYNGTSSLHLSTPFDENEFNVPGMEIEGFVNGMEAATIYKIRFWAKYNGSSDQSNGPLIHVIAMQDGDWLDYIYIGASHDPNEYVDKDWKFYSFQIATITSSPLELIVGTNLENVFIDDIHIVKKDE